MRIGFLAVAPLVFAMVGCGSSQDSAPGGDLGSDRKDGGAGGQDGGISGVGSFEGGGGNGVMGDAGGASPTIDAGSVQGTTVGFFVGVNAMITDSVADIAPIGVAREYHNWGWLGNNFNDQPYPQTLYTPNIPDFKWSWDSFFSDLRSMGVSGFPAVQGGVPWVSNGALPPAQGSPTAAASYLAHGDTMFQIAARWGKAKVPDAKLKLEPEQTRSSGLGTVEYFEDFNEQDNVKGFTGDVFAAMASADYDGDQMRLGATIGVKNADPSAKLVMGGLSGAYGGGGDIWINSIVKFLDAARTWSMTNRGGSFPADVINVHYYSFGPGSPAPAVSPEDDKVQSKLQAVVAYRDKNLPGKPVWWTEFGYDTYAKSPLHAPAIGANSAFIVQGQWLVRSLLAALGAGIERATLFELDDTCTPPAADCDIQFATAGLLAHPGSAPKASWFFLATFRARLQTMVYTGEQTSGQPDIKIFQFKDTKSSGGALVVWASTSTAAVHAGYALALPSGAVSATAVALVDKQKNGMETVLTPAAGSVTIDVTETPTIVLCGE